ncbi:MAG: anaerobic ribonucleoside-triphosphate reductase activating protein [Clostridia bacterium]|nr:anaerobic ribonucleoside-triphosphate reductase activating protein [Clostridia bacterium]
MKILGFQKMTLLDYPGKVACTIFTGGCNFRCPFCHNALLVTNTKDVQEYTTEEILSFLEKRQGVLDGVCITGGEPLMNKEIFDFARQIKALGFCIKLDTNGSFPDRLEKMIDEKLCDYVAMDIKNCKEKYPLTAGFDKLKIEDIDKSVQILLKNEVEYEFRTTVVKELHTIQDIEEIAKWIDGAPRYFLQNFENSGNLIAEGYSAHSPQMLKIMKNAVSSILPKVEIRGV